jgi:hypothetical protein
MFCQVSEGEARYIEDDINERIIYDIPTANALEALQNQIKSLEARIERLEEADEEVSQKDLEVYRDKNGVWHDPQGIYPDRKDWKDNEGNSHPMPDFAVPNWDKLKQLSNGSE